MKGTTSRRGRSAAKSLTILVAVAGTLATSLVTAMSATESARTPVLSAGELNAAITLPQPKRYAVVEDTARNLKSLYTTGDVLIDPQNARQQVIIHDVAEHGLVILAHPNGQPRPVTFGQRVPGFPERRVAAIVTVTELHYRFKVVGHVTQPESVLISLRGSTAILEKEVSEAGNVSHATRSTPASTQGRQQDLDATLLERVQVSQLDEHTYELDDVSLQPVIENVRATVSTEPPTIGAIFSPQATVSLNMRSAVGAGTLDGRGFTVTRINVAQTFGLQVGDTVLSLNGRAVNSPLNAWMAFQELLARNHGLSKVSVDLLRGGTQIRKTYKIR